MSKDRKQTSLLKGNNHDRVSRRAFLVKSAGLAGALMAAGPRVLAAESGAVARLTVQERGRVRVLAFTDLHFFNRPRYKDAWTMKEIKRMVTNNQPDLIVVCGDMWMENPRGRGFKYCEWACEQMAQLRTPWALARGNHDKADDSAQVDELLANAPYSQYRGAGTNGNYTIEITNPGESRPFWDLIIINDAFPEMGFKQPQIDWFNAEAARIKAKYSPAPPAFVFAHIPLPQYQDLVEAGLAHGVKQELSYNEEGSRDALAALRDSGMVRAMFCGHDHVNNYYGVMEGVHLEYVRATGHGGYGGYQVRKGGTLITAEADHGKEDFFTESVFPWGRAFDWEREIEGAKKTA